MVWDLEPSKQLSLSFTAFVAKRLPSTEILPSARSAAELFLRQQMKFSRIESRRHIAEEGALCSPAESIPKS